MYFVFYSFQKKLEARLKSQRRYEEKKRRMAGQSYLGFRISQPDRKWIQDVPKSERKMGPPCSSNLCTKGIRGCEKFKEEKRLEIFNNFWNNLDWNSKKKYVRSLVEHVPPKRRRLKHKGEVSRKGSSKHYYLLLNDDKVKVCRVMFLNTLGVKETMVRTWLENKEIPRKSKKPIKSINVDTYIDTLPKMLPRCLYCRELTDFLYINLDNIKNIFQLYNQYLRDMKVKNIQPASRKTFSKVLTMKKLKIFKPKNDHDICDLVPQHNNIDTHNNIDLNAYIDEQNIHGEQIIDIPVVVDKNVAHISENVNIMTLNYYYHCTI